MQPQLHQKYQARLASSRQSRPCPFIFVPAAVSARLVSTNLKSDVRPTMTRTPALHPEQTVCLQSVILPVTGCNLTTCSSTNVRGCCKDVSHLLANSTRRQDEAAEPDITTSLSPFGQRNPSCVLPLLTPSLKIVVIFVHSTQKHARVGVLLVMLRCAYHGQRWSDLIY